MTWITKIAYSDRIRIERNIQRLESLRDKVHDLSYFVVSSQTGGFRVLAELLEEPLVQGKPLIYNKLSEALIGENNQKIALDSPTRFQNVMNQATILIDREIIEQRKELKSLSNNDE